MGFLCFLGFHKWKITGRNFFMRDLERKCEKCGCYEHKPDGRNNEWVKGRHATHIDREINYNTI